MIHHKLILGALVAGCLSLGSAWSDDIPGLTDEQKARFEELRKKIEEGRDAFKGRHDSLLSAHKDEIARRIAAHKAEWDKLSDERKAVHEKVKALVDEYKAKLEAAGADKDALAAELKAKLKALHEQFAADHKAAFDALKKAREADLAAHKAEWEKRMADRKAELDARLKDLAAKREEWLKNHPDAKGGKGGLTPEKLAELKAQIEKCVKDAEGSI